MTNKEYQEMVEDKYGKPLEAVMYDLCVNQDVVPTEGASILGVPKNTFNTWRSKFRFGPMQRIADQAKQRREDEKVAYSNQLQDIDLFRPFKHQDGLSLDGFQEVIERNLELYKAKRTKIEPDTDKEISIIIKIGMLEETLQLLEAYQNGSPYDRFMREVKRLMD